jgi:1-deoxy-D-xylulose-5-phosphate reductoisomerase
MRIVVLGATGTIGKMSLDVIEKLEKFELVGIQANVSKDELLKIKVRFPDAKTALTGLNETNDDEVDFYGKDAVERLLASTRPEQVIVGVSGFMGLKYGLIASKYAKRLCLANKESIVAGGNFFLKEVEKNGCEILPVDSEHSAVYQLLDGEKSKVKKIILTASGGALRDLPIEMLKDVTPKKVLKHPVWKMGARITVDSATMFNKGLEVMEAHFLFHFKANDIEVMVHPQGKIHAMIELEDGTFKMHVSRADMRMPISYAMNYPQRVDIFEPFSPIGNIELFEVDNKRYPALKLAYEVLEDGDGARTVYNAADEVAVAAFLSEKIRFTQIYEVVNAVLQKEWPKRLNNYDEIENVDKTAREVAKEMIKRWH